MIPSAFRSPLQLLWGTKSERIAAETHDRTQPDRVAPDYSALLNVLARRAAQSRVLVRLLSMHKGVDNHQDDSRYAKNPSQEVFAHDAVLLDNTATRGAAPLWP